MRRVWTLRDGELAEEWLAERPESDMGTVEQGQLLAKRQILTRHHIPWLLAMMLVGGLAVALTPQVLPFGGWQKAVWIQIEVSAEQADPPNMQVYYNSNRLGALVFGN